MSSSQDENQQVELQQQQQSQQQAIHETTTNGKEPNTRTTEIVLKSSKGCDVELAKLATDYDNDIGPTWKRYIILLLFSINAGNKGFQWIQVPAITTKAALFYGVNNYVINATSTIFMMSFVLLSWPACYLINQIGLRKAVIIASFGAALGSVLKLFSCHSGGIWLLILAQIMVSFSEQLIYSVPPRLASVWFPDNEVSTAVAMCFFGNQLGVALGFQLPHLFVQSSETVEEIGQGIWSMYTITAIVSIASFIIDYLLFDEEPKRAPGLARFKQREIERNQARDRAAANVNSNDPSGDSNNYFKSDLNKLIADTRQLVRNSSLIWLAISYGIRYGLTDAISTLLDQTIAPLWPDDQQLIGIVGFMIVIGGTVGLPSIGRILDHMHIYKTPNFIALSIQFICLLLLSYYLIDCSNPKWLIYLFALLFGLFHGGAQVASLELATELTYPGPELVTTTLMSTSGAIFGIIFVFAGSYLVESFSSFTLGYFNLVCLLISLILLLFIKEKLNRQMAVREQQELKQSSKQVKL